LIAILENFQDERGAVSVPDALVDFGAPSSLGGERLRAL
jgi:seryl-tRNA synthetase